MKNISPMPQEPEFDRFAASTQEAIRLAQREASRLQEPAVYPEHLFLGLIAQGNDQVVKVLSSLGMDLQAIHARVMEHFCPSCKRGVQPQWKHCVYCGAPLAKVCPKCGAPRADVEGAKFCFECGFELA